MVRFLFHKRCTVTDSYRIVKRSIFDENAYRFSIPQDVSMRRITSSQVLILLLCIHSNEWINAKIFVDNSDLESLWPTDQDS